MHLFRRESQLLAAVDTYCTASSKVADTALHLEGLEVKSNLPCKDEPQQEEQETMRSKDTKIAKG